PRNAMQTIESLDSTSLDIAPMIDHYASVELGDRYRRGHRNASTPRLYPTHRHQIFAPTRPPNRSDAALRATVRRYTPESERLPLGCDLGSNLAQFRLSLLHLILERGELGGALRDLRAQQQELLLQILALLLRCRSRASEASMICGDVGDGLLHLAALIRQLL